MNSKQLYVNICQIISTDETGMVWPQDYDRECVVHVSRSSNDSSISHITLEYAGIRAKFFCCIVFDGTGNYGVTAHSFAMPKLKLTLPQKALVALSVLSYLIETKHLDANFEFFREKICTDLNGGVGNTLSRFDLISFNSLEYLDRQMDGRKVGIRGLDSVIA